jgi:hypothetical protein
MRSGFKPVDEAGLGILDAMAIARQRSISHALIQDQLHIPDPTAKVCMEVSRDGRVRNLILLVGRVFGIGDVEGMSENTVGREESDHEAIPV